MQMGVVSHLSSLTPVLSRGINRHKIQYESDSAAIRRQFEDHGQIKTFFDLIHTRGMVFVTYVSRPER
jgi:hypothetical protein